jgi:hypothetical protein
MSAVHMAHLLVYQVGNWKNCCSAYPVLFESIWLIPDPLLLSYVTRRFAAVKVL